MQHHLYNALNLFIYTESLSYILIFILRHFSGDVMCVRILKATAEAVL